jgi:hypothetical protein
MWFTPTAEPPADQSTRAVESYLGALPWAGTELAANAGPQAFLAIAGYERGDVGVHFHAVDQFQYFVGGRCTFGGHPAGPGVVHYADRLRPYGPIQPESSGVTFLTLRGRADTGAFYMPEQQPALKAMRSGGAQKRARNVSFDLPQIPVAAAAGWQFLVDDPDGLCIVVGTAGPGAEVEPWPGADGDAYAIVVAGEVCARGQVLRRHSFRHLEPDEPLGGLRAGDEGARVAVLCLPRPLVDALPGTSTADAH